MIMSQVWYTAPCLEKKNESRVKIEGKRQPRFCFLSVFSAHKTVPLFFISLNISFPLSAINVSPYLALRHVLTKTDALLSELKIHRMDLKVICSSAGSKFDYQYLIQLFLLHFVKKEKPKLFLSI